MMIIDRNGKQISGVFFVLVLFFLRPPSSAACCFRPLPAVGCLRPLPEGGATGAAPIGSRAVVEALVHQLLFLRLGSSWSRVWWRVAPEAGPGPGCVQSSGLATMPRCALVLVLLFLRAPSSAACCFRPPPAVGCLRPLPEGGATGAAPIGSRPGVQALVHQLLILTSGSCWARVWRSVPPDAGPGPGSVLVRPLPAAGCSGPPPAGGARRAAPIGSRIGVEKLVHQLLILTSGRPESRGQTAGLDTGVARVCVDLGFDNDATLVTLAGRHALDTSLVL